MYYVYILKSLRDGTHYYGSTGDLNRRLRDHNAGRSRFTKGHRPYLLVYFEECETRNEAQNREFFFKSITGYRWLKTQEIV